jgi:hypothetical protein
MALGGMALAGMALGRATAAGLTLTLEALPFGPLGRATLRRAARSSRRRVATTGDATGVAAVCAHGVLPHVSSSGIDSDRSDGAPPRRRQDMLGRPAGRATVTALPE